MNDDTGTDRVELTEDLSRLREVAVEVAADALREAGTHYNSILHADKVARLAIEAAMPSFVERVEEWQDRWNEVRDERDQARTALFAANAEVTRMKDIYRVNELGRLEAEAERDAARAELAAANTSAAEKAVLAREWADKAFGERAERDRLQAEIERLRELMTPAQKELDGIGITWQSRAKRMAARVAALQETLDRVISESSDQDRKDVAAWLLREADKRTKFFPQRVDGVDALMRRLAEFVTPDLRAALTPEGTE